MNLRSLFRSKYEHFDFQELISSPVESLIGVSPEATKALTELGIFTVFDLGSSRFFSNARSVSDYSSIKDLSIKFGMVPSDWVDAGTKVEEIDDLGSLGIEKLRDVGTSLSKSLGEALNVTTIKELAYWPPYHAATQIVRDFAGSTMSDEDLQSEELRPRLGEYPTERVYYDTLVMLQLPINGKRRLLDGPLSISGLSVSAASGNASIPRPSKPTPAIAALLTYSQSWNAQGLTLGHLLHSLALAPGESTRIAMIDWSRKSSAGTSESISETDAISNSTNHSRAVSEVQTAVATEMQMGGSESSSSGKSLGSGGSTAAGGGGSGSGGSATGSGNASVGVSGQFGKTSGKAASTSWSVGTRSVGATMTQNVNDRTEQHAASVRNRRASAVREVSQNEHEQISTRIVANYNHMHALTIQYFEVVQIYRVTVKFHKAQRCLMIPMDVIDFSDAGIIERFREELSSVALAPHLFDNSEQSSLPIAITTTAQLSDAGLSTLWSPQEVADMSAQLGIPVTKVNDPKRIYVPENTKLVSVSVEVGFINSMRIHYKQIIPETGLNYFDVKFDASMSVDWGTISLIALTHITADFATGNVDITKNVKLRFSALINDNIVMLPAVIITPNQWRNGKFTCLTFKNNFVELNHEDKSTKLIAHLKANADYYSSAIYRNMDDATMFSLLNQYEWNGNPLAAQVEPRAFTVAGNYLVFMAPVDMDEPSGISLIPPTSNLTDPNPKTEAHTEEPTGRSRSDIPLPAVPAELDIDKQFASFKERFETAPTWERLLAERHIIGPNAKSDERLVPIPTTGVFAEAVLGRSNSAEKLDITRFWNWQDSPIPLAAPEIAAIQAGSRAQAENLMPGQLGAPGVTIVNPAQLPDPAGLAAVMGAVQNGNMFRDMSGLAGTQAAMTAAIQAAGQAGQQAGANATTGMTGAQIQATAMHAAQIQKDIKQMEIAGDIAKMSMGIPPAGKDKVAGISGDGARINHGRNMDERNLKSGETKTSQQNLPKSSSDEVTPPDDSGLFAMGPTPEREDGSFESDFATTGATGSTSWTTNQFPNNANQTNPAKTKTPTLKEELLNSIKSTTFWKKLSEMDQGKLSKILKMKKRKSYSPGYYDRERDKINIYENAFSLRMGRNYKRKELLQVLCIEIANRSRKSRIKLNDERALDGKISCKEYLDEKENIEFEGVQEVLSEFFPNCIFNDYKDLDFNAYFKALNKRPAKAPKDWESHSEIYVKEWEYSAREARDKFCKENSLPIEIRLNIPT